jgi:hypothetical protein
LSNLVFEGFGSCGDLACLGGFDAVFERDACDDFREVENWYGASSNDSLKAADRQEGNSNWSAAMSAKGYTQGPRFNSYDELSAWDSSNARSHVRSHSGQGYQVYFTDEQPHSRSESTPDGRKPSPSIDDEIPF